MKVILSRKGFDNGGYASPIINGRPDFGCTIVRGNLSRTPEYHLEM